MRRYVIEREIAGIGGMSGPDYAAIAKTSNDALAQLEGVQWEHSYVVGDKTFCIYLAEDEAAIRRHAALSGFPADRISLVTTIVDPTTAAGAA